MVKCPNCNHEFKPPRKSKVEIELLDMEKVQYACHNFAGIVKSVEYFENHFGLIRLQPMELFLLAATGYYAALGSLIRNKDGMDYTKIFEIWEMAMEKNLAYTKLNDALRHNIGVLREWEKSLAYEMEHILSVRDQYIAHIDFVEPNFLMNSLLTKDKTKQNDLSKFFRCMVDASNDYFLAVNKVYHHNKKGT